MTSHQWKAASLILLVVSQNFGKGRIVNHLVMERGLKVHRSVKLRISASGANGRNGEYRPRIRLRMTDHKATRCTNECLYIYTLARERPGPCPLRWAVSIVFKPHIWNHCTNAVLLKAQRTPEVKESERTTTLPRPSATSTPDRSVSLTCAMREFSDIEELTSGGATDGHSMDAQATVLLIV